jgi:hypothetical protein
MESTRPHLKIVLATITTVKNGSKWSFHSAATLADVSSKIGALATGEAGVFAHRYAWHGVLRGAAVLHRV